MEGVSYVIIVNYGLPNCIIRPFGEHVERFFVVTSVLTALAWLTARGQDNIISDTDQTALQGLLRRLYSLSLSLISVICVE